MEQMADICCLNRQPAKTIMTDNTPSPEGFESWNDILSESNDSSSGLSDDEIDEIQTTISGFEQKHGSSSPAQFRENLRSNDRTVQRNAFRYFKLRFQLDYELEQASIEALASLFTGDDLLLMRSASDMLRLSSKRKPERFLGCVFDLKTGLNASDEQVSRNLIKVLARVAQHDSEQLTISMTDVNSVLERDNEMRKFAYRVLEACGTTDALEELRQREPYEPGDVGDACQAAIQEIENRSTDSH